ncbi:phosphoribosyltransferase [Thermocrispum municipale]|uniref:phosphoribosyltransferase n=1 Tax=Thermocrispum municipale TaxID=37926 RepID=UPI00041B03DA|nr:phosphoribosyltransferase family protein [Thermocrispum municipale]
MRFRDRVSAGRQLGMELTKYGWTAPVVLALPRGGVPVAAGVAAELQAPLDVVVARKIGAPAQPELAVGAVTADGAVFYDDRTLAALGLSRRDLARRTEATIAEARRKQERYRSSARVPVRGRDVLIVDDGLATGLTALAAVHAVLHQRPLSVSLAVPVGSSAAIRRLEAAADAVYCLRRPPHFRAVGEWYHDFTQVTDDEVDELLEAYSS